MEGSFSGLLPVARSASGTLSKISEQFEMYLRKGNLADASNSLVSQRLRLTS